VGDDAMLYALLQEFYSISPERKFAVLSSIPLVIPSEIKDRIFYIKYSLLSVGKEIFNSSNVIIGGGTQLFDQGNKTKILKIQLKLFLLLLYAKLVGKKIWLINIGIGPIQTNWGKVLPNLICHAADYISVRDIASYKYLERWGFIDKSSLAFDLAVLIESSKDKSLNKSLNNTKKILGISITPVFEHYYKSKENDALLIDEISNHLNYWIERESQLEVRLFIFHGPSRKEDDISITQSLYNKIRLQCCSAIVCYDPDPTKMLEQVGQCNAFIGMRYHSCVFAYINEIPLLIIDYHHKCRAFADEIGLPKYAVISLEEILNGKFGDYLKNFLEHPKDFIGTLPVTAAKIRANNGLPKDLLNR